MPHPLVRRAPQQRLHGRGVGDEAGRVQLEETVGGQTCADGVAADEGTVRPARCSRPAS